MLVLVTGGAGSVGLPLVQHLVASGHTVRVTGRRVGIEVPDAEYVSCDITDFPAVRAAMSDVDGIIHLAAIPNPTADAPQNVYQINCSGTFNIYQAAADIGLARVITASSINALGYFYGLKSFGLDYLPVDEDHRSFATDAYSLSKYHIEELGRYFWRREGIDGVSLRIPGVYNPTETKLDGFHNAQEWACRYLEPKFAWTDDRKRTWAEELEVKFQGFRDLRPFEWRPEGIFDWRSNHGDLDDDESRLFFKKTNFFTSLDTRDCARAFELALTGAYTGFHSLFVNDSKNGIGLPSRELASLVYPDAGIKEEKLHGTVSLVSIEKAGEILGFEPEYSHY